MPVGVLEWYFSAFPIVGIDLHDWVHEGSGPHLSVVAWKESGYEGSRPGKYFCLDKFFFFTLFGPGYPPTNKYNVPSS